MKKNDLTDMKPGLDERKWEIDSLCYPARLAYKYWQLTGDKKPNGKQIISENNCKPQVQIYFIHILYEKKYSPHHFIIVFIK